MALKNIILDVAIPEGVNIEIGKETIKVNGPCGSLEKRFYHPKILIRITNKMLKIEGSKLNSKERIIIPTFQSLIKNCIRGVVSPYIYELKICSGHFPIKAGVENGKFIIKNLFGEKEPRSIDIPENVKVKASGSEVKVESVDKEAAGQTAANIERATIRSGFDKRVFQDGIYIVKKADEK